MLQTVATGILALPVIPASFGFVMQFGIRHPHMEGGDAAAPMPAVKGRIREKVTRILDDHHIPFEKIELTFKRALPQLALTWTSLRNWAQMQVNPDLYHIDFDAFMFTVKHEFGYVVKRDPSWNQLLRSTMLAGPLLLFHYYSGAACVAAIPVSLLALKCFSNFVERRADNFAIKYATDDELKAALRLTEADLQHSQREIVEINSVFESFYHVGKVFLRGELSKQKSIPSLINTYFYSLPKRTKLIRALESRDITYEPSEQELAPLKGFYEKFFPREETS